MANRRMFSKEIIDSDMFALIKHILILNKLNFLNKLNKEYKWLRC